MTDDQLLRLALEHRLVSRKQQETVINEMAANPGVPAATILLRRFYLTHPQIEQLLALAATMKRPDDTQPVAIIEREPEEVRPPRSADVAAAHRRTTSPEPPASPIPDSARGWEIEVEPTMDARPSARAAAASRPAIVDEPTPRPAPPPEPQRAPRREPEPQPEPEPAPAASSRGTTQPRKLVDFLRLARHWNASDFHIAVGRAPFVRIAGELRYMEMDAVTEERAEQLLFAVLGEKLVTQARESGALDFALEIPNAGRYRCSLFRQRLGWDGAFRIIPAKIPTVEELGLPPAVCGLMDHHQGFIVVTGGANTGKTTTVAALLDLVNRTRQDHIITVEDPIEYIHTPVKSHFTQREIVTHTRSFDVALAAALREDPDILLIGELRDRDSISMALSAAETGHLVLGTMHTGSAGRTIGRLLEVFPASQRAQVGAMMAESIKGIVTQQLVPRKDGQGRALALEILIVTPGVGALVKDGKTHQLSSAMQAGKRHGMQLMDESLGELLRANVITAAEAWLRAENKALFEQSRATEAQQPAAQS